MVHFCLPKNRVNLTNIPSEEENSRFFLSEITVYLFAHFAKVKAPTRTTGPKLEEAASYRGMPDVWPSSERKTNLPGIIFGAEFYRAGQCGGKSQELPFVGFKRNSIPPFGLAFS
jgi:hypothetical protein